MNEKALSPRKANPGLAVLLATVLSIAGCASTPPDRIPATPAAPAASAQGQDASLLRLARAARSAGNLPSAVNLYRSIAAPQADPAIPLELGNTLEDLGLLDEAITAYQGVDRNTPARIGALVGLVRVHLKLGQLEKALGFADEAWTLAPDDPRVLVGRGVVLDTYGDHAQAQQYYRHALEALPNDVAARNDLALSLALTSKFDEAIEILTPIALSAAATPQVRQNLALIYGLKGDRERATQLSRLDLNQSATDANIRLFDLIGDAGK